MKNLITKFLLVFVFSFFVSAIYAQSGVGKLSGKVIDAATKDALIGANIVILESQSGAATDLDGNYFICLLYTSPSPRDRTRFRMPSSAWKKKT